MCDLTVSIFWADFPPKKGSVGSNHHLERSFFSPLRAPTPSTEDTSDNTNFEVEPRSGTMHGRQCWESLLGWWGRIASLLPLPSKSSHIFNLHEGSPCRILATRIWRTNQLTDFLCRKLTLSFRRCCKKMIWGKNPHTSYTKLKRSLKQFWARLSGWGRCFTEVFWFGCGCVSRFESCCFFSGEITKEVSQEIQAFKQWPKPWLFAVYRELYFSVT